MKFLSAVCEWQQCMEITVFVCLELPGVSVVFINTGGISGLRSTEVSETQLTCNLMSTHTSLIHTPHYETTQCFHPPIFMRILEYRWMASKNSKNVHKTLMRTFE